MDKNLKKYKIKLATLKRLCNENFSNRMLFALTGLEDIVNKKKLRHNSHYIDFAFENVVPELRKEPKNPSKALAVMAFSGIRGKDYDTLVKISQSASAQELQEFLDLDVEFNPKEKVADYLTFPLLAMMTKHLKSEKKVPILLHYPELLKKSFDHIRSKTLLELLSEEDRKQLDLGATDDLKPFLKPGHEIPASWGVRVSTGLESCGLDLRTVQALGRWPNIRRDRQKSTQTGVAAKLKEWEKNHNPSQTQLLAVKAKGQKIL